MAPARTTTKSSNGKPAQYSDASGDFLAFVEDMKRSETRPLTIGDKTFYLRGPALLNDDEVTELNGASIDVVAKARAVIDDYDGFTAAGGTAMLLMKFYDKVFAADAEGEGKASSRS